MGANLNIKNTGPIEGVVISPRKQIGDSRGMVMHHVRSDDPEFAGFGESYISTVHFNTIKAWKRHKLMTQLMVVPVGQIQFILFDARETSLTKGQVQEIILGCDNYSLLRIPPMVWYGFKGLAPGASIIVNCANLTHHPEETERRDERSIDMPHSSFQT